MKRVEKTAFIGTLAFAVFFILAAVGLAQDSGGGKFLKSKFISENPIEEDETTSTSFTAIPNTTISFKNNKRTRVRVTFSAQTWCQGAGDLLFVRVLLDGASMGTGEVQFQQRLVDNWAQASTFTWVSTGKVAPGSHTVEMQSRVSMTGDLCKIWERNTIVDYFK